MNKSDTITIIRSLLSSSTSHFDVLVLNREFRRETGTDIPLHGYQNIHDFLRSMPETVTLRGEFPNQQVCLVKSQKSAHIVSLVEGQKKKNRKKLLIRESTYTPLVKVDNGFQIVGNNISSNSDEEYLYKYLKMCADGATFSQIKNLVKKPTNWEKSFKQFNILNFTKTFPLCLFYNDKFYHVENFKDKIARNSPYC